IIRLVRELRPTVVWSHLSHFNLVLASVRPVVSKRIRVIVGQHSMPSMDRVEFLGRGFGAKGLCWYRRADLVVACSPAVRSELVELCGLEVSKVDIIENPVDTGRFNQHDVGTSPYDGSGPNVLGLGSFKSDKAFQRLIEAFGLVGDVNPTAELLIVGDGAERSALEALAKSCPHSARIHMPGVTTEPELWMCHADVFVSTSRVEAQPLVVLEGLACGTPVVAYDAVGGIGDVLRGASGALLVDDGDTAGMAEAIAAALQADFPRPALPAKHTLEAVLNDFERLISQRSDDERPSPSVDRSAGRISARFRSAS
ncbi:MAG: glycosyltransferase, partial [Acidimicrobiales bacterium]